jgi:ABC-type Na+ efflux pump permease subunit
MQISLADLIAAIESPQPPASQAGQEQSGGTQADPPEASTGTDEAVRTQLEQTENSNILREFKGEFVSDKEIIVPSLMDPPMPLAQVTMAFLYIVPIFFISVFFTSSFIEEKTGRKLIILLSAPVTPILVILGKMLPTSSIRSPR